MQPDLAFLQMVTRDQFLPSVKDNVYDTNRIFVMMKKRIKPASGTSLSWVTTAKRNKNVGLFAGFSLLTNQAFNPYQKLALDPGQYYGTVSFPKDELLKNVGNKEKLLDMAEASMKSVKSQLIENLGIGMYSDGSLVNGYQGIIGLAAAVTGSSGTYAGVDRSDASNAYWRANANTTSYSADDLENPIQPGYLPRLMATMFSNATHEGSPTILICHEDVFNHYALIAQVQNLRITEHPNKADLGFQTLGFQGATMLFDKYCPAYRMYMLNENDWTIYVYPGANMDFDEQENGSIWIQGTEQLAKVAHIIWMGQMRLDAPRQQAVLTGLGNG